VRAVSKPLSARLTNPAATAQHMDKEQIVAPELVASREASPLAERAYIGRLR
jgi:hypothetical protein